MRLSLLSLLGATTVQAVELILPLYNHPLPNGAGWSPVQQALARTPWLDATVIINVDHGPGNPFVTAERDHWITGGRGLGDLPNVSLLGYVPVARCLRPIADVQRDVATWLSWQRTYDINISGIFLDEAPNDGGCLSYMRQVTNYIRRTSGLPVVVLNPGFPATPHALDVYYDNLDPTFMTAIETCFSPISNGQDLCVGSYTVYDQQGYGTTIDNTLGVWVGQDHYWNTAILVHGFHGTNGLFTANVDTLRKAMEAIVARDVGAAVFTTNHWITPDAAPADISTLATVMDNANGFNERRKEKRRY